MQKNLKCIEWINVNKNARLKIFKNHKNNKSIKKEHGSYLLQVVGHKLENGNNFLACLTSDQIIKIYDQENLSFKFQICSNLPNDKNINEIGFFKKNNNMIFACNYLFFLMLFFTFYLNLKNII
jgi:hypothetical protein